MGSPDRCLQCAVRKIGLDRKTIGSSKINGTSIIYFTYRSLTAKCCADRFYCLTYFLWCKPVLRLNYMSLEVSMQLILQQYIFMPYLHMLRSFNRWWLALVSMLGVKVVVSALMWTNTLLWINFILYVFFRLGYWQSDFCILSSILFRGCKHSFRKWRSSPISIFVTY